MKPARQGPAPADLAPAASVDSSHPAVIAFAREAVGAARGARQRALRLYQAVRDRIRYDPYRVGPDPAYFRASACLEAGRGFCIPKAALMSAAARSLGIAARVGYADVRNHLTTPRLATLMGGDVYHWHSYSELYLDGRWVKCTPAFNAELCRRFGVQPLVFDGRADSLFQAFDLAGRRHMEYLRERGSFADVPVERILADFERHHPRWLHQAGGPGADAFAAASD